ncbi:Uncharacterised protein [Serratia proteamaculans]|jgi:hypothetical protein|nr:Uncharacterised protein [Serratia proteamaculans]CAI0964504.1 Uncharacterised protein [Serratia proteamaculans]
MFGRVAVGSIKKTRTVGFSSKLRVTAYSYVKMLKIYAKPCKNKMNLINSQQGHFRYAAHPSWGRREIAVGKRVPGHSRWLAENVNMFES